MLEIDVRREGDVHVVVPRGDLDLVSQGQLTRRIEDLVVAGHVHLVVDLDSTTFLDSTGLGALIGARRKTYAFRGSFALVCTNPQLLKVLRMTALDRVFEIRSSHVLETVDVADSPA
ncbi:MAG: STAS domain-containing protein [Nocardioides sp.]